MAISKHNRFNTVLASIGAFCLLIAMLFTSLRLVMGNEARNRAQYEKLGIAASMGMSDEDVLDSLMVLVDYMEDKRDDIKLTVEVFGGETEMFNERETAHMVDVKRLYLAWRTVSYICFGVAAAVILCITLIEKRKTPLTLSRGYINGISVLGAIGGILAVWAIIDFNSFWIQFHMLFFNNDLWLLDPRTSRMINMLPSEFFSTIIAEFAMVFLVAAAALLVVAIIIKSRAKKRESV